VEINSTGVLIYIYSDGTIKRIVNNWYYFNKLISISISPFQNIKYEKYQNPIFFDIWKPLRNANFT
jgi:hypothetical protein